MPVRTACPIALNAADRVRLKKMAYSHKTEYRLRVRAQVVLHAARGRSNARIARETGLHLDTVRRWRGRFARAGLHGLKDRQRYKPPGLVHTAAGRRGQGAGLSAAHRERGAAFALVVSGTGP
ncbi:helix-turn-helix domain-containing protein [Streptomyces sp. NPDC001339]|uniref:helix-turn-helix domain-containing protein n=1 Tax=Streptomyces sp. NPDC001339 TaxID=3364563 RepID=UPI0036B14798